MIQYLADFLGIDIAYFSTEFSIFLGSLFAFVMTFALLKVILIWIERIFLTHD